MEGSGGPHHRTGARPSLRRAGPTLGLALVAFLALNLLLFRTNLYRGMLDPESSTGSFERAVAALRERPADASRDVLVLGDSRVYDGLLPEVAARASGGTLRFVRAAIPGTTPRCWFYLARAIDPSATRYRALVIPVDTLGDDDSAIGSIDANDREDDLHYLVYELDAAGAARVAGSFDFGIQQAMAAGELVLGGPLLHDDVRALLSDPAARARARAADPGYDMLGPHAAAASPFAGLAVDYRAYAMAYPASLSESERLETERQVLPRPRYSAVYASYRHDWIDPLVRAYLARGRPVVFVRIPTRPLHRTRDESPSGTIAGFARLGAEIVDPAAYLRLERPWFFGDHDHLDAAGAARFSTLVGRDVAAALAY